MRPRIWVGTLAILIMLLASSPALAAKKHNFDCDQCHDPTLSLKALDATTNLCLKCHRGTFPSVTLNPGDIRGASISANTELDAADASDAMGTKTALGLPLGNQTSHNWGSTDNMPAAGAQAPTSQIYSTWYNYTAGAVTCSRCHDPHATVAVATDPTNMTRHTDVDTMCLDCHRGWDKNDAGNPDAFETHPMVADYAAVVADTGGGGKNEGGVKFQAFTPSGEMALVSGGVSCSTCHGLHWADSDSSTADGYGLATPGDGNILRADGPTLTGGTRNGGTGTAQLRSNLCQSCHTYKMHGKGAVGDHQIGCLECHGGHSYNNGSPSDFVLRADNTDVPTRIDGTNSANASVTFGTYSAAGSSRTKWSDDVKGTAGGYCEQCHGDVQDDSVGKIGLKATEHLAGNANECTVCHLHNGPSWTSSFQVDASAASCGACHGFPPYLNDPGNRDAGLPSVDGGYAFNDVDVPNYNYSADTSYFKDETQTAHKTHAGADLPTNPAPGPVEWYFVGSAGIENCQPCHGPDAGSTPGGHRVLPGTDPDTFRNVPFNTVASANGNLIPVYKVGAPNDATCSQVYCHSNGAPRTSDIARDYTGTVMTPVWVGTGVDGFGSITGSGTRCQFCHGNDATSMNNLNSKNSAAHQVHLGTGPMAFTYDCDVCHAATATSATALVTGATDGRTGGKHVNSVQDVDFSATALGGALSADSYDSQGAGTGTCSVYCHDPSNAGTFADWDVAGNLGCADCHDGRVGDATVIATGSHTKHVSDAAGPQLACADCHGVNADAGTHTGHVTGAFTVTAGVCDTCHGYDVGETQPVWGDTPTADEYCITCHTGATLSAFDTYAAPAAVTNAVAIGHNKPSLTYGSGNAAAAKVCTSCHDASASGHFDVAADKRLKENVEGFPLTYAGNENAFCGACHGATPGNAAPSTKTGLVTHQAKGCVTCHNVHGDATDSSNIYMVSSSSGDYAGTVALYGTSGADSYDEDDGAVGGAGEVNADDLCATCHTVAGGTAHNNADNSTGDHNQGADCFSCHAPHTDATPFAAGAGTACNDCHGFPPASAAHRAGSLLTDPELHSLTATNDKDIEDRSDCAYCHTGADLYTYDPAADQASGNPDRDNHAVSQANRQAVLNTAVGYSNVDFSCATACHTSGAADGAWTDGNGIACDACHYYSATPTSAGNAGDLTVSHDEHFDAGKVCSDCHSVENGGAPIAGELGHITDQTGATDALKIQGMAAALQDEGDVVRGGMTFDDPVNNTCSGGIGLGCHATGTPDWDVAIPNDGTGCADCHTGTSDATVDPTSGLHGGTLTVTANNHAGTGWDIDGSDGALTGDCTTCHTTSPSTSHRDGTLDATIGAGGNTAINFVTGANGLNYADAVIPTCSPQGTLSTCHSEGGVWTYNWDADSRSDTGAAGDECDNCHGDYGNNWNAGVIHDEAGKETRGSAHNSTGTSIYPCMDCHNLGATAAVYNFTSGTADWSAAGEISHHGDGNLNINDNTTGFDDTGVRVGCATVSCHGNDANHDFQKSTVYTVAGLNLVTQTGDVPSVPCSGCHGGLTVGDQNNYWPDGLNTINDDTDEDNSGEHSAHIVALAAQVYGETATGALDNDILRDNTTANPALTSDVKQKELCSYCHTNPGGDGDHGVVANLPAETNSFFTIWNKTLDDGAYNAVATIDTCATTDCHNNKTTPDVSYGWYDNGSTACVMCHLDVTTDNTHTDHTGASATFGITIGCADCHEAATAWGAPGTPPASGHINGTFSVDGGTVIDGTINTYSGYTYPSVKGSCGTNDCHEDGAGGAPAVNPYNWDTTQADCTVCHLNAPATGAHGNHMANTAYVVCTDCHTAASNAAHIGGTVTYDAQITAAPGDGSCTNTCHIAGTAGDWTGGAAVMSCADCHSGTYIGGDPDGVGPIDNMPVSGLHAVTAANVTKHDATLTGGCEACHTAYGSEPASHVDGTWEADLATQVTDSRFVSRTGMTYTEAAPNSSTCFGTGGLGACHSDGGNWNRLWSTDADVNYVLSPNPGQAVCNVCHGLYSTIANSTGWRTGTVHATSGAAKGSGHTDANPGECEDCHGYTSAISHEDGFITMSGDTDATLTTGEDFQLAWGTHATNKGWYCASCHNGNAAEDALLATSHTFVDSLAFPSATKTPIHEGIRYVNGASSPEGGCANCHGDGASSNVPDGSVYPDIAGTHGVHTAAIAAKRGAGVNDSCNTCHVSASDAAAGGQPPANHQPDTAPARVKRMDTTGNSAADTDLVAWRHIATTGAAADADPVYKYGSAGSGPKTCSNIDCHWNVETPTWFGAVLESTNAPETLNAQIDGQSAANYTVAQGASLTLKATVDDSVGGNNTIEYAEYRVDYGGSWTAMTADTALDSGVESFTETPVSTAGWSRGKHTVYFHGKDLNDIAPGPPAKVNVTITTPDTLQVSSYSDTGAGMPNPNVILGNNVPMLRLDLSMVNTDGQNKTTLTALDVGLTGSAADVAKAAIYLDDGNQAFDINADTCIGSANVGGASTNIPLVPIDITTANSSLFVVLQVATGATISNTLAVTVPSTGYYYDADDTDSAGNSLSQSTTIQSSVIGDLYVTADNTSTAGDYAPAGSAGDVQTALVLEDSATAYMSNAATRNAAMTVQFADHTTETDTINAVNVTFEVMTNTTGRDMIITPYIGATPGTATNYTLTANGVWENTGATFNNLPRPGGGNWTWADIDALNFTFDGGNHTTGTGIGYAQLHVNYGGGGSHGPATTGVTANGSKALSIQEGSVFTLAASVTDAGGGNDVLLGSNYQADTVPSAGSGTPMGGTTTAPSQDVNTTGWTVGDHWVYVYSQDDGDGWGDPCAVMVSVFDGDGVTLTASDYPPPAQVGLGEKAAYLSLEFVQDNAGDSSALIDTVTLTKSGTLPDADVTLVGIYDDLGNLETKWDSDDNLLGTGTFSAGSVTIDIDDAEVYNGTTTRLFAVMTLSTNVANDTLTVGTTIAANGYTVVAPDGIVGGIGISSTTVTNVAGGGAAKCGFCHTVPIVSGAHLKHSNTDMDFIDCDNCHGDAANSVSTAVGAGYSSTGPGIHNDTGPGSVDLYFGRGGSPSASWTGTTCTTADCHFGNTTPLWASEQVTCTSCHNKLGSAPGGAGDTGLLADSHPGTGKHAIHVANSGYLNNCQECHGQGANDGVHAGHRDGVPTYNAASSGLYLTSYASGTDDCTNSCHTVPANSWNGISPVGCTDCHSASTYGPLPGSGLHATTTAMPHDDVFDEPSNFGCEDCHDSTGISDELGASTVNTHRNGTTEASTVVDINFVANINSYSQANGCAATCHNDGGTWQRKWNGVFDDSPLNTYNPGDAVCDNCHGDGIDSADGVSIDDVWRGGMAVDHAADWDGDLTPEVMANHNQCELCHGWGNANYDETYEGVAPAHGDGFITMNVTGAGYTQAAGPDQYGCTSACHSGAANTNHQMAASGRTMNSGDFGSGSCTSCHDGATQWVSESSSHTLTTGYSCVDCHTSHGGGDIVIPNMPFLGIDYSRAEDEGSGAYAGVFGISLSDPVGSGTTEAEICWNCHSAQGTPVSEWGTGTGRTYDFGTLTGTPVNAPNWTTASWQSANQANFSYKNGAIQSVHGTRGITAQDTYAGHAAKSDPLTAGDIGCSYCHNVHGGFQHDGATAGKPYLRASWTPNPFPEDGAPYAGLVVTANAFRGTAPRAPVLDVIGGKGGATDNNLPGGWQIEQNNGAFSWTDYATDAGICNQCHSGPGIKAKWAPHASVVPGLGVAASAQNIMDVRRRRSDGSSTGDYSFANIGHIGVTGAADGGTFVGGLRDSGYGSSDGINPADAGKPEMDVLAGAGEGTFYPYGTQMTVDGTTTDPGFHNFPCAKCHNPHASRLPRLMITNCLDVQHNSFDDAGGNPSTWNAVGGSGYTAKQLAYSPTAHNCHRYVDDGTGPTGYNNPNKERGYASGAGEVGWNTVTPWRDVGAD